MAEIVYTATVHQSEENVAVIAPLKANGQPGTVDKAGFGDATVEGGAEWALEASDPKNLTVVLKSDMSATEFPSTTTTRGSIDADTGEGKKPIDITFVTITIDDESVTAGITSGGNRPRS